MNRLAAVVWLLTTGAVVGLASTSPPAKTVKEIMTKINKGTNMPLVVVKRELDKGNPNWAEVQTQSKEYATLVGELKAAKPPKGTEESWAKSCKEYAEIAKSLDEAAQKKDAKAALAAREKLTKACAGCHKNHKE